ncbi:MAG: rod shape-determining protein, partial [Aquitalea sp.]|nr:rod shape-determining protein [Aquitalea sp.]
EVPGVGERGPRQMSRATLAEVVEPRVEELFQLVQQELRRSGFEDLLSSGIVLTGGASLMPGMVELAEEVFHMPVRVGVPKYVGGLAEVVKTPRFSTGVGLLLYGKDQIQTYSGPKVESAGVGQLFGRMKAWFAGNF